MRSITFKELEAVSHYKAFIHLQLKRLRRNMERDQRARLDSFPSQRKGGQK